ncbi:Target of rapamycin complex 1 subunit kog1 [Lecanora helva]
MTVIASPPSLSQHRNINGDFARPSNIQNNQSVPRPSQPPAENGLSNYNTANILSNRSNSVGNSSQVNGHAAGDIAAGGNHNLSPEQQELIRSRTENQRPAQRPRAQLARTQTDFGPNHQTRSSRPGATDEVAELRHFGDQYNSKEFLGALNSSFYMYFTDKRHETGGKPTDSAQVRPPEKWRDKDRQKTVSAALVLCLNLGVDPPDLIKTNPCASMECWQDTMNSTASNNKLLEIIGKRLQEQYENMSIKTRYKQYLDPSIEETKKFCVSLRRNAKEERVLFHYNGHGVPLPTPSGEFWVFNRDYTQYIPVSMYDLQTWLGGPCFYIYDISHAGNILANFDRFIDKHLTENAEARERDPNAPLQNYTNNIQLAACTKSEMLPTNPELPADLFTCCLTTPIDISIRYHVLENEMPSSLSLKDLSKVPGRASERRSPMGELNWILTAITDTIAWNVLPPPLFRMLFRQDLMAAALFRNFLVAQRIMRAYGCHPESSPAIPDTHDHPLWESWDLAIEIVLAQLPAMLAAEQSGPSYEYQHSTFFAEQLVAFKMYLEQGAPDQKPPPQLPIVLQVLLSQQHRLQALVLLSRFLDLGPWAVSLALTIGIFPYVVKLLQSPAIELKPIMIFIWGRIVAVDITAVQQDLLKDNGYQYFTNTMLPGAILPVGNPDDHQAMSAFVTAMFCRNFPQGKNVCLSPELIEACIIHIQNPQTPLLRQWACLCISMLWGDFPEAKWVGIRCFAHHRLCALVIDPIPEVRAAAIHALTNFLGIPDLTEQVAQNEETIASALVSITSDGNAMVRKELLVFFSTFVKRYQNKFLVAAYETLVEERDNLMYPGVDGQPKKPNGTYVNGFYDDNQTDDSRSSKMSHNSVQGSIWYHLLTMSVDPHPEVAQGASTVIEYVHEALLESPLGCETQVVVENLVALIKQKEKSSRQPSAAPTTRAPPPQPSAGPQASSKNDGHLSTGLRRNASVAAALKYLGLGGGASSDDLPAPSGNLSTQQKRSSSLQRPGVPAEWSTPPNQNDPTSTAARYEKARAPMPKGFKKRDENTFPMIPLQSSFFEWSIEYFREPQMKPNEPDEPGSDDYNARLWRRERNDRTLDSTQPLKGVAASKPWDINTAFFNNGSQPMKMCFHQFENHLAIADDRDSVCIWNWQKSNRLNRFSNGNPKGSKINETCFINEDDNALLMTGSSDGVIKIYRNYESEKNIELVSAFRALTDLVPSNKNAGLVLDWQQGQGKILVAGDVKVVRVWNAATEICTNDIPARSGSCITSLTSDQVAGHVFAAGYGDGAIRIFDTREKPSMAMVKHWRRHKQWITNIHMQRGGFRELVSGSRNGEVRLWDIRKDEPVREIEGMEGGGTMRTLSVHEHAPVFATGSDTHALTLFNVNGHRINNIRPYSPLLTTLAKSSPIACTAFHPHRMQLAVGSVGHGNVEVFSCVEKGG